MNQVTKILVFLFGLINICLANIININLCIENSTTKTKESLEKFLELELILQPSLSPGPCEANPGSGEQLIFRQRIVEQPEGSRSPQQSEVYAPNQVPMLVLSSLSDRQGRVYLGQTELIVLWSRTELLARAKKLAPKILKAIENRSEELDPLYFYDHVFSHPKT